MKERAPSKRRALGAVTLYLITDASPRVAPMEAFIAAAVSGGVGMVQLREKTIPDGALLEVALRCAAACRSLRVPFIINDRVDLALACGADGVHVGQEDVPVKVVRQLVGEQRIIGLSTHTAHQIDVASELDVDYIGVGPVHATPTKEGRPAVGLELVRYAAGHAAQPFFAIGGLEPSNVGDVAAAGARGVSILRWISRASDPRAATKELLAQFWAGRAVSH